MGAFATDAYCVGAPISVSRIVVYPMSNRCLRCVNGRRLDVGALSSRHPASKNPCTK